MSIRTRLLLLLLAIWLPAIAGFGFWAHSTYQQEAVSGRLRVQQLAQSLAIVVERELDQRASLAQALASSSAVQEGDLERFHRDAVAATNGTKSWAILLDETRQYANTLRPFDRNDVLPRLEGAPLVAGPPRVYFTARGPVVQKPLIAVFAAPAAVADPRFNVAVAFSPQIVQSVVSGAEAPEGGVISIVDAEQRVMARSREPDKWLGLRATGELRQRAEQGLAGFAESTTLDGVPSLTYLSPANRYGWRVVIGTPRSTLFAAARRVTLQAVTGALLLFALGVGLASYGAARISRPVLALRDAAAVLEQNGVPDVLETGLTEADEVSKVLHSAGVRSLSAQRLLEEKVAQAVQAAEDAQAKLLDARKHEAIGRLTGGIAHDFNNLLQTMTTAHHLLDRVVRDDVARRALQGAMRATSKAADLVRQMLAFGRARQLHPRPVDLQDLVLKSHELTAKAVGERISLRAHIEPALPALFADPVQLELALLNLVFNARDAMPDGGEIVIRGRRAAAHEVSTETGPGMVWVEVEDSGVGMSKEVQEHAFDPYFTTKPTGQGSGLGLAQVRAFARQSAGEVSLVSEPGRGTTVRMLLPVSTQEGIAEEPAGDAAVPGRPLRILLVEDDLLVASVVVPALEADGHQVTLCGTADEAAARLQRHERFDVLFTDVVMPGQLSGLDLVAWCRQHRPELPAVVATGYSVSQPDPSLPVLRKPYGVAELLRALRRATLAVAT